MSILLILFDVSSQIYGIKSDCVLEIIPAIEPQPLEGMPPFISGYFDYRGQPVPIIDINRFISGVPAQILLSTRLILLKYSLSAKSDSPFGLLAEKMTNMIEVEEPELLSCENLRLPAYVTWTLNKENKAIHCLDLPLLFPKDLFKDIGMQIQT